MDSLARILAACQGETVGHISENRVKLYEKPLFFDFLPILLGHEYWLLDGESWDR